MSNKCQKCGKEGEDRRTLWMACFYQMNELNIPFTEKMINGTLYEKIGEKKIKFSPNSTFEHTVPVFDNKPYDEDDKYEYRFYTLWVCKSCRADWMGKIKEWYNEMPFGSVSNRTQYVQTSSDKGIAVKYGNSNDG